MYSHNGQIEYLASTNSGQSLGDTPYAVEDSLLNLRKFCGRSTKPSDPYVYAMILLKKVGTPTRKRYYLLTGASDVFPTTEVPPTAEVSPTAEASPTEAPPITTDNCAKAKCRQENTPTNNTSLAHIGLRRILHHGVSKSDGGGGGCS